MGTKQEWTAQDAGEIIDVGREIARGILDVFDPDESRGFNEKAAAFKGAGAAERDRAVTQIKSALQRGGMPADLVDAHIYGAEMLIDHGHDLAPEADRRFRR
jgi:hypothetical protein